MKKIFVLFFALSAVISSYTVSAQPGYDFDAAWKRFNSKKNFGKVQDARAILDSIYTMADRVERSSMKIKVILKGLELDQRQNSDFYDTAYARINTQLAKSTGIEKNIWNSVMGQLLHAYYDENRWTLYDRTTLTGEISQDFRLWDIPTLVGRINHYYLASLENDNLLKATPIKTYDDILVNKGEGRIYRPTVYDFLAFRAFDYFSTFSTRISIPSVPFSMNNEAFFAQNRDFVNLPISSPDSLSADYYAMKILQDLTKFHLHDANTNALIELSLNRYDFVSANYTLENKRAMQYEYLSSLDKEYKSKPGYHYIALAQGKYYFERAREYEPGTTDEYKWDYKTALAWLEKAVEHNTDPFIAEESRIRRNGITSETISFSIEDEISSKEPALYSISYKNTGTIYCRLIPISRPDLTEYIKNHTGTDLYNNLIKLKYTKNWKIIPPKTEDFRLCQIDDILPAMPYGTYVLLGSSVDFTSSAEGMTYKVIEVCDISYKYRKNNESYDLLIFNRKTGEPIPNAKADIYIRQYNDQTSEYEEKFSASYKSNKNGEIENIVLEPKKDNTYSTYSIQISALNQLYKPQTTLSQYRNSSPQKNIQVYFFTDRKIYRPGQTVYYKGIVLEQDQGKYEILRDTLCTVSLYDPNSQLVQDVHSVFTNEYGSFSGSFTIPLSNATGQYRLEALKSSYFFNVEEYKRPKFEVQVEQPKNSFRLNENVEITGYANAYSGYPIDGATVKYRVIRTASFPYWRWWWGNFPISNQQEIVSGSTVSDETGKFTFSFQAIPDDNVQKLNPLFSYKVMVDVTDISGETHSSETTVKVGAIALQIDFKIPESIDKQASDGRFRIITTNLSDQPQPTALTITVSHLTTPKTYLHARTSPKPDTNYISISQLQKAIPYLDYTNQQNKSTWKSEELFSDKINTNVDSFYTFKNIATYKNGYYKILLEGKDAYNTPVSMEYYLLVYGGNISACPAYEPVWLIADKVAAEPGETITYTVGSYLDKANVLVQVFADGKKILSNYFTFRAGIKSFKLPVIEEYRGNIVIYATVSQHNKSYSKDLTIPVPFNNKQLDFEFLTFRDKLYPGSKEQWKLKIKGFQGDKIAAELLCSMYDASLDAFSPTSYALNLYRGKSYNYAYSRPYNFVDDSYYASFKTFDYKYPSKLFENLDWKVGERLVMVMLAADEVVFANDIPSARFVAYDTYHVEGTAPIAAKRSEAATGGGSMETPEPQIRSNFNETAFFFPQLETDAEGNVLIGFTMPESLTKWKFLGLAHTKDLKTGSFEKFVQTQKDLMIVPNQPRFFREGDTMFFTSKVVNLTEKELLGSATLEFSNSISGEKINLSASGETLTQSFVTAKGASAVVQWKIVIPSGVQALTYKVIARSGNFSDGEEMTLSVLSNRMLVTESLPLPINGKQTKTFVFKKMKEHKSNTLQNFNYTLEFTSNPAWYAIQSLPYMMEYPYECNEQIFSRLYANSIATHIANSSPKIKQVFDSWKLHSPDAFLSGLEKNQELKNIVLEETPWVLDARNESERKQKLGLLFDVQRMANETQGNIDKLISAQQSNGSWAWFKGMPDNWYITQHILAGFGHLKVMNVDNIIQNNQVNNAIKRGVAYIDGKIQEKYSDLTKMKGIDLSKDYLGSLEAHYLYTRSYTLSQYEISKANKEAFDYYLGQGKKYWQNKSIYTQAMLALALYRMNEPATAKDILNSIKQRAQYSEELGMYWKKEGNGFYWYEAPIERQSLLIEAFSLITQDEEAVEKMKVWLLKQKQTQNWGTTKATAEACYALLLNGTDILTTDANVSIQVGKNKIEPDKMQNTEAGTGYSKTSWDESQITQDMSTIVIEKPTQGVAWGAVYWQYFENLDKITPAATPLSVKKNLYKVALGDRGEILTPITRDNVLQTGDKVRVRVEIRVDRDMEYVHLKDMRAAAFEPVSVFSQTKYQNGLFYYESTRDAATNFFFHHLPKGVYVFEYTVLASQKGWFSNGITTIQCMYAPEFSSHSEGIRVKVE